MDPIFIVLATLGITNIALIIWVIVLERRISRLLSGSSGASLESTISENQRRLGELFTFRNEVLKALEAIDGRLRKKLHGAKTLRFNPFAGTGSGGNQSFATALLDEEGNGVVISTLYSREKMSIFAKPVKNKTSEFELSEEEQAVLK